MRGKTIRESKRLTNWFCFFFRFEVEEEEDRDESLVVVVEDRSWVREWRLEAEREARAGGMGALTDDEVADFVDRFLPAYDAYLPGLYSRGPFGGGLSGRTLTVRVDRNRNVLDV